MTAIPDVAILTHRRDRLFSKTDYLIHALSKEWESAGLRVVVLRGIETFTPAGALVPHVDTTAMPPEYRDFTRRYPRVVNLGVSDVFRTSFSENLVGPASPEDGPVIVKTNRNHGGLPELRLRRLPRLRLLYRRLRRRPRRWRKVEFLDSGSYPVYPSISRVPREVFENPRLVVERFLPEREGELYAVRYCYALGFREVTVRLTSKHPIIKGSSSVGCERVENSEELRVLRRRLGLDYGKIDFVQRDGRVVVLDVNPTPACASLEKFGLVEEAARDLAPGIADVPTPLLPPTPLPPAGGEGG
jgi:hypothetical protein